MKSETSLVLYATRANCGAVLAHACNAVERLSVYLEEWTEPIPTSLLFSTNWIRPDPTSGKDLEIIVE